MKILLLGFYYPPDVSAGAFRARALAEVLGRRLPAGVELRVITTMPNRFGKPDEATAPHHEVSMDGRVKVTRLTVMGGGGGMAAQAGAFLQYAAGVMRCTRGQGYDLVVATSSRLMMAVLGRRVAERCGARLYQDIRDNFVENLPQALPGGSGRWLAPLFGGLERWALGKADRINLVSRGFAPYFERRYPAHELRWHTNGIDAPFVEAADSGAFRGEPARQGHPLRVLYAGNLGMGQGIERILPKLAARLAGRVVFRVIGAGGRREALCRALVERGLEAAVRVEPPMARSALLEAYRQADVLFLHLNPCLPSLESVLPSKLFEYAATGKPIWAGLAGYSACFVAQEIDDAACFTPDDVEGAIVALERLESGTRPRLDFVARWRRDRIMETMADDILALVADDS